MTGNIEGEHNVKLVGVISNKRDMQSKGGGDLSLELKEDSMKSSVGKNHLRMTCCCWNLYGRALRFIEFVIRKTGEKPQTELCSSVKTFGATVRVC